MANDYFELLLRWVEVELFKKLLDSLINRGMWELPCFGMSSSTATESPSHPVSRVSSAGAAAPQLRARMSATRINSLRCYKPF